MQIKGVNLGNWLVLEKWMSPALFEGTNAEDEYYLAEQLPKDIYEARIKIHRSEYISERDFATIAAKGLDTVRIPIPYFIYGDRAPFIGCIDELDKAFSWAEKYKLKILIDLHTVPMSQNGFDNGGISGVCKWSQLPEEVEFVLNLLEKLSKRYGQRDGFFGIEPLNEPVTKEIWEGMGVQKRYPPVDAELAQGSRPNTIEFIRDFYERAFDRIIPNIKTGSYVVFHDAFDLMGWEDFVSRDKFKGKIILDTHQYLMMAELFGCEQTVDGYVNYIREKFGKAIEKVQSYVPVVCGEWCLFNSLAVGEDTKGGQSSLNGMNFSDARLVSDEEKANIYSILNKEQQDAWKKGSGFFYWSYKLLLDTVNEVNWRGWDSWDFGKSAEMGWFKNV